MNGQDTEDDEPGAQPVYPSRGPDREEMVSDYLPGEEEWVAKTVLDLNDPHAVSALQQFYRMFPEVDDLQPIIDGFSEEFLKGRTSIEGSSREEYKEIFQAMYGSRGDGDGTNFSILAGDLDDD